MNLRAAVLSLAQVAPAEPRNLVPAWNDDPLVTFIAENPEAKLQRVDRTPESLFLQRKRGMSLGIQGTTICAAPCNVRLSSSDLYQVSGEGVMRSRYFTLPRGEHAIVKVRTGSSTLFGVGIVLLVVGSLTAASSIVMLAAGGDYTVPGFVTLGGGLGLMTAGTLTAMRGVTTVEVKGDEPVVRPLQGAPSR